MLWNSWLRGLAFVVCLAFGGAVPRHLVANAGTCPRSNLLGSGISVTMRSPQVVQREVNPRVPRRKQSSDLPQNRRLSRSAPYGLVGPAQRLEGQHLTCFQVLDLIKIFGRLSSSSTVGNVISSPFDSVAKAARAVIAAERCRSKSVPTEEKASSGDLFVQNGGGASWLEYDHPSLLLRTRSRTRSKNGVRALEKWEQLFIGENVKEFNRPCNFSLPDGSPKTADAGDENECCELDGASLSDVERKRIRLFGVSGLDIKSFAQRIQNMPFVWPVTINTGQRPLRMKFVPVAREHLIDTCRRVQAKKASGVEDSPNVSWAQINSSVSEDSIAPSALACVFRSFSNPSFGDAGQNKASTSPPSKVYWSDIVSCIWQWAPADGVIDWDTFLFFLDQLPTDGLNAATEYFG